MHDNSYPKELLKKLWQTPATMTHSWGWHANDFNWKTSKRMIKYLVYNASMGGHYLLNIGLKPDGRFPVPAVQRLREIGAWLHTHGDAIYNTKPIDINIGEGLYLTQKAENGENIVFITATEPIEQIIIPIELSKIKYCRLLDTGMSLNLSEVDGKTQIQVPAQLFKDCSFPLIKLTLAD